MKQDIGIIGAGPAGVTAAVYAVRAGHTVTLYESAVVGGQAATTAQIENYPGFASITGTQFAVCLAEQLAQNAVEPIYETIKGARREEKGFMLTGERREYSHRAIIIANGVKRRTLGCPGEAEFTGRGVSYCAVCDGAFFRGKRVAVVGGGNSAAEEAIYLAGICERVFLIHRRSLTAMPSLVRSIKNDKHIELLIPNTVAEIRGADRVQELVLRSADTETRRTLDIDGVFIAIGLTPDNNAFSNLAPLDTDGYICADGCRTATPGVFAAGDTRAKKLRQIVTAASDGARAAQEAARYLETKNDTFMSQK